MAKRIADLLVDVLADAGTRRLSASRSPWSQSRFGNDQEVAFASSQGNFQLNVYKPVMLHNVLITIELLTDACRSFYDRCAIEIEPNKSASESISVIVGCW